MEDNRPLRPAPSQGGVYASVAATLGHRRLQRREGDDRRYHAPPHRSLEATQGRPGCYGHGTQDAVDQRQHRDGAERLQPFCQQPLSCR